MLDEEMETVKKPFSSAGKTKSAGGAFVKNTGSRVARFQAASTATGDGAEAAEVFSSLAADLKPVTNQRLSGEKTSGGATLRMNGGSGGGVTGHRRTVRSAPPLANQRPSG